MRFFGDIVHFAFCPKERAECNVELYSFFYVCACVLRGVCACVCAHARMRVFQMSQSPGVIGWSVACLGQIHMFVTVHVFCNIINLNSPLDTWRKGSRNSIGGLFLPPQIRLLTMLWSFEKDTILTP